MLRIRLLAGVVVCALASFAPSWSASAATVDATCDFQGGLDFRPPIAVTAQHERMTFDGASANSSMGTCPASTEPATITGTLHSPSASCDGRHLLGEPAVGQITITWPDATSTVKLKLAGGTGSRSGVVLVSGRVLSGLFAGDRVLARIGITQTIGGDCVDGAPTSGWSFDSSSGAPERLLTFNRP